MNDLFDQPDGSTPLDPDEREGLLQEWMDNRDQLNEAERGNITSGAVWARRRRKRDVLSIKFLCDLHQHMFGNVWVWAGKFRSTEKNIGIDPVTIGVELSKLLDDVEYWIEQETYPSDEIAIRFHHRLTQIHPFPNGNGRHARLVADLLREHIDGKRFSWGRNKLITQSETRKQYISALRKADAEHEYADLITFARS